MWMHIVAYIVLITRFYTLKTLSLWFVLKFLAEITPNVYNIIMTVLTQVDAIITVSSTYTDAYKLQRIGYYYKPVAEIIGLLALIVNIFPMVFGSYLWYFGDGSMDRAMG